MKRAKKMKQLAKQLLSVIVAIAVITTSVEMPVMASKNNVNKTQKETSKQQINVDKEGKAIPEVVKELKKERTENSNTYLLNNGMKKTVYYSDNIRYEDENGDLKEYNPELTQVDKVDKKQIAKSEEISKSEAGDYLYTNTSGDTKQYIPEKISEDTPILMTNEKYRVSFAPLSEKNEDVSDSEFSGKTDNVTIEKDKITDAFEKEKEADVKAVYSDNENKLELSYQSLEHGIKEDIILNEKPESNVFAFGLTVENMTAEVDVTGGITFIDEEKDKIIGGIDAPFMNDASGEAYSEDVYFELEKIQTEDAVTKYVLKVVADEKYLASSDRQYPVTIDPSVTWNGISDMGEAYVLKSSPDTNYYSSGVKTISVGKGSQGVFRTYFRAMELSDTVTGKYVESAVMTLYENGANTSGVTIQVKPVKEAFKCKTVTWTNQPGGTSDVLTTFKSSGTADAKKTINLTQWARNIAKGSGAGNKNYGLIFRAKDESVSSYVKFYGARAAATAKRPKLAVTYYDGPTTASSVTLAKTHLKSGENLQVTWAGISSKALDYVQYRVENCDDNCNCINTNYIDYSSSTKIGTTASGTKTISGSSGWKEGNYKLVVRGVDKGGIKGTGKGVHFTIDRTNPVITSLSLSPTHEIGKYSKSLPTLKWSVNEKNPAYVQVSINGGTFTTVGTTNTDSKVITGLKSGITNTISIRAIDKAGNVSTYSSYKYNYDNTKPIVSKLEVTPSTDSENYNRESVPKIEYSVSDSTLNSVSYSINGSDWISLGSSTTGTITPAESLVENGENVITLKVTDLAGNVTEQGVSYFRDNENPTTGKVTITPKTGVLTARNVLPVIKWEGFEDDFLKEMQISINDGEYKTLGIEPSGEAQLEAADFTKNGGYKLKIRAIDKAGNTSEEIEKTYYYKDTVSEVDKYTPTDIYTVERLGGSTVIRFSNVSGTFPGDIGYEVHRGTTPLFVPGDDTLVKTGGTKGIIEVSADMGTTYYYKLRAVTVDGEKKYSEFSEEISSETLPEEALNTRNGAKDIHQYVNITTPNGTGNIELSEGNFMYEQSDIELPAPQIPISISRVYNSKSQTLSEFGYGWSSAYDMYVASSKDKQTMYFQDGTKAVYVFKKNGEEYTCDDDSEMKLTVNEETVERTITDIGEDNTEKKTEIEFENSYIITTKENEKFYFDDCGRLNLIEESNDTFVYIEYDSDSAKIKSVVTSRGQKAEYTYSKFGESENEYVSKISIANGSSYSYEYENDRMVKAIHNGTGEGTIEYKYAYDNNGVLCTVTDAMDNDYSIEYLDGNVSKFIYPNGEYYGFEYSDNTTVLAKYTSDKNKLYDETYKFTKDGKISESIDAMGNVSTYNYQGQLLVGGTDKIAYYKIIDGVVKELYVDKTESVVYDEHKNITKEVDSDGNITTYTYDYTNANEKLWNFPVQMIVTNAKGEINAKERYEYDDNGNVTSVIDEIAKKVTSHKYQETESEETDTDGLLKESIETIVKEEDINNVNNNAISSGLKSYSDTITYNNDGDSVKEESQEEKTNISTKIKYDSIGNIVEEISKSGDKEITTVYEYDEFGRITKITEISNGKTTTVESEYDRNGTLIKEKDKAERISTYQYDEMNRVTKQTVTAGSETKLITTSYGYESVSVNEGKGKPKEIKNASVIITKNTNNELIGKTYKDNYGRIVRELKDGLYVDYSYDSQGRVFTTYTGGTNENDALNVAEGKLAISTYDENGNQTDTIINPEYNGTNFIVGENSIVTSNVYDNTGMLVKSVDAKGNATTYEYDVQGRLTAVNLDDDTGTLNRTVYTYDIENVDTTGKLESTSEIVKDALGRVSETVYDGAGKVKSIIDKSSDGNNIVIEYKYDVNGNKSKEVYSDGSYVTYEYDEFNYLIKSIAYDNNKIEQNSTSYKYDDEYNLEKTIDSKNGTPYRYTIYQYDKFGRKTGVSEINSSSEPSQPQIESSMLTYVYDIDDNITKIYYPKTENDKLKGISFRYNKDKWIVGIDAILIDSESSKIRDYEYYSDGKIKNIKDFTDYLNGGSDYIQRDYEYDVYDRVTSMKYFNSKNIDKILEQYDYTYDKNSNILTTHTKLSYDNNLKDEERSYEYDSLNRLIKTKIVNNLTYEESEITYAFDKAGNRTSMIKNGVTTTYTYNDLDQLVKSVEEDGDKSYTTTYEYDKKGNQIKVTDEKNSTVTENTYDVDCQLVSVTITKDGEVIATQENQYNGAGQRISKTDNGVKTCYYYEENLLLYTTDADGNKTSQNIYGNQDNIISSIRYDDGQHAYFYSKDIQGSTSVITDEDGNCVTSYDYTDYGETTKKVNAEFYNEICYTGGVYDELTGQYYLNARYYDPESGVFLSQDTYRGEADEYETWNLYAYCAGNPTNYIDPSGHKISWSNIKKKVKAGYKKVAKAAKKAVNKGKKVLSYYGNKTLKYITQVDHFGGLIDAIIIVVPGIAGFKSAIKSAKAAKNLTKEVRKNTINRSAKVVKEFLIDEMVPEIEKYSNKKIASAIKGIIPTIVDGLFAITGKSIGQIIANVIDAHDNCKNNGYVFTKY